MIAAWMVYILLATCGITLAAVVLERGSRSVRWAVRPAWIVAICVSVLGTFWSAPLWRSGEQRALSLSERSLQTAPNSRAPRSRTNVWPWPQPNFVVPADSGAGRFDSPLLAIWLGGSLLTLGAFAGGAARLRRTRLRARVRNIGEVTVGITEDTGPLVAGINQPRILLPAWVLELDAQEQQLVLAHELAHVRGRDPVLLLSAALIVASVPWNPLLWYMLRRLRQAVEIDCDRRVLTIYPDVHAYARLLISVAGRKPRGALSVNCLAASASSLDQRFRYMTASPRNRRGYRLLSALAGAAILLVITAMIPQPIRGAPEAMGITSRGADRIKTGSMRDSTATYFEFEVDEPVTLRDGAPPKYPPALRKSGVKGEVVAQFVVDETGRVNMQTFKALRSPHPEFVPAIAAVLPDWRLEPATRQGKKVKQVVQQSFVFRVPPDGN